MPSVTIRSVPDAVRDELAARAARSGRSLQEYLLGQLVELAARPDLDAAVEPARARVQASRTTVAVDDILAARDTDRR
jgi:plasmid stability protein